MGTLAAALLFLTPSPLPQAAPAPELDRWAQWRGPSRDGRFHGPAWPDGLDRDRLQLLWSVGGLGLSYATPLVAGDRVYTVETHDETYEVVRALDRSSGKELWKTRWEGAMKVPFFAAKNGSWIRATPALDGDTLFVAGMRDMLVALDAQTGETRWSLDLAARAGGRLPDFGFVSSPLVRGEHVYVQAGAALVKVDRASGEVLWSTLEGGAGGDMASCFSSPVVAELGGREQLLVLSRSHMNGIEPQAGELLWSQPVKSFRGMNILTPLPYGDDGVFTAPYGGRAQLLRLGQGEDAGTVEQVWDNRVQGYMTSPVLVDGHAYLFLRSNRFACIDLETGEEAWISPPTGDEYWSLIVQGDRILALANTGILRLVQATPEAYTVQGEVPLIEEGSTWAHLAAAGDQLFVRELGGLMAYRWK